MRWTRDLTFRLRALVSRNRMERELEEEFGFHLDMEAAKLQREGLSSEEARRRASAKFGAPARQRDRVRWAWGPRPKGSSGRSSGSAAGGLSRGVRGEG